MFTFSDTVAPGVAARAAEAQATANEAKAKTDEQKATNLARSETTQRQRAEASEQEAKDQQSGDPDRDLQFLPHTTFPVSCCSARFAITC